MTEMFYAQSGIANTTLLSLARVNTSSRAIYIGTVRRAIPPFLNNTN